MSRPVPTCLFLLLCLAAIGTDAEEGGFVGSKRCADCHAAESAAWRGSHHDLAMQVADRSTVLGAFDGREATHYGSGARFFTREGRFFVHTEGADGVRRDFRVRYVFGVEPLQQYLVEFPDGRVQALPWSWDTRPPASGGQRWFHLYEGEAVPAGDPLHWTGIHQNWNHVCADCHSTNLRKNYDASADRFRTVWSQIDVGCEACHGPGADHLAWAGKAPELRGADPGLAVRFEAHDAVRWRVDPVTGSGARTPADGAPTEREVCARCHSRRQRVSERDDLARPLAETHRLTLLEAPAYHADGQVDGEVYVYGSFLQSRMARAGVRCSDCHDPHAGTLRAEGNALCGRCHDAGRFDTPTHHHHPAQSAGARCVECHMPSKTFMGVDERRDHSLRVPRPDLSRSLGVPNACATCHAERGNAWAAEAVANWGAARPAHWGEALHAGRAGAADAEARLRAVVSDPGAPDIARATALQLSARRPTRATLALLQQALRDPSPLLRLAAVSGLEGADPRALAPVLAPALRDPADPVRQEAARLLAALPETALPLDARAPFREALAAYRAAQERDADRPDARLRLGALAVARGELDAARAQYEAAIALDPHFTPAVVNLADLYRAQGQEEEAEGVLRAGIARHPGDGDLQHSLGLLLVRTKRLPEALEALARAASLRPDVARYAYVHAVALDSAGDRARARAVAREAAARHPEDPELGHLVRSLGPG